MPARSMWEKLWLLWWQLQLRTDLQMQVIGDLRIGVSKSLPIRTVAKMNPRERP